MAAAVSEAGALGSIGIGASDAMGAGAMIAAVREKSAGPLNVNVFCHRQALANAAVEMAWPSSTISPDHKSVEASIDFIGRNKNAMGMNCPSSGRGKVVVSIDLIEMSGPNYLAGVNVFGLAMILALIALVKGGTDRQHRIEPSA